VLISFFLAEFDYLLATRVGGDAGRALLGEVGQGAYRLEPFSEDDVAEAMGVIERHAELGIGLADASNVVLANRHGALDILTLDERHFRVLRGPQGRPFRLLPADVG
jgi:predicted nucleic acid-binding protein